MKALKVIVFCSFVAGLSGCGGKETSSVDVPPPPVPTTDITATSPTPPPPATPEVPPPPTGGSAPILPAAPDNTEIKMTDAEGKPLPVLEYLNMSVQNYDRIRATMTEGNPWPELTDLNTMVKVGFMKRMPTPPAGQKFHYDPQTMKVTLVPAN